MKGNESKYKLVVNYVTERIRNGMYRKGDRIPSINEFRKTYNLSRSTVFTGINELRSKGIIESAPGVGYFISSIRVDMEHKIFMLFNELNIFKEDLYNSFIETVGDSVTVDLFFHNYNRQVFESLLYEANGKYTTYIIMSGKFEGVGPLLSQLSGRVFLLDHFHSELMGNYSAVFQNFKTDTYNALVSGYEMLKKYNHIIMVQKNEKEPEERYDGLCMFCSEYNFRSSYISTPRGRVINAGEVYLVVDDRDLVFLLKLAEIQNMVLGKDFGIISYNDTLLKEVLAGGIATLSTDFKLMGRTMASLININEIRTIENPWALNLRKSI